MLAARQPGAPLVHEAWGNNVFLETRVEADLTVIQSQAAVTVRRHLRTARQCMSPLEAARSSPSGTAAWSKWCCTPPPNLPHLNPHRPRRLPGAGRGSGAGRRPRCWRRLRLQGHPAARGSDRLLPGPPSRPPVRWIEDRREQLAGNANCREHDYDITAYADADGRLLAVDCSATVDAGAYSIYPFSACLEAAQIASILPGPYMMDAFRCVTWSSATNKPGIVPYRGVARAGVCYAIESVLDDIAHATGQEPFEVRLRNLVPADAMPFDNITNKHFDSGDYPQCLRRAVNAIDIPAIRRRQRDNGNSPIRIGVGVSIFCEQGAHGTSVYQGWGIPMIPGYEQAVARMTPDGGLEIRVGIQSHGQGLETTLAQVAHQVLGIDIARIRVVHGDTAITPYSTGTWGSRCMVMAGGAVATACRDLATRIQRIGAHLLQVPPDQAVVGGGTVSAGLASVTIRDVAAPGICARTNCRPTSRPAAWRSPAATAPSATAARSAMPRMRW